MMREVVISGILTGISGLIARIAMKDTGPAFPLMLGVLLNPVLWISSAFGIAGFAYLQKALYKYNISFVGPAVSSIAIITPLVLAAVVLGERISIMGWAGVVLILIGIAGIGRSYSGNLYSKAPWKILRRLIDR